MESLNSIQEIAKFEREQTRNIERLKREVKNLRKDLYSVNQFYGSIIQLLSAALATICLSFAFRKGKEEKQLEEIQPEQIPKL